MKDELIVTIEKLLKRRDKFDYIIIETTGLANPGPLASSFFLDAGMESQLYLDSIVTLVDCKNIEKHLQNEVCSCYMCMTLTHTLPSHSKRCYLSHSG